MKQTAVQFVVNESMKLLVQYMQGTLNEDILDDVIYDIVTKALEMEKEHIRVAYMEGAFEKMRHLNGKEFILPEQYYNTTFKSE